MLLDKKDELNFEEASHQSYTPSVNGLSHVQFDLASYNSSVQGGNSLMDQLRMSYPDEGEAVVRASLNNLPESLKAVDMARSQASSSSFNSSVLSRSLRGDNRSVIGNNNPEEQ